MFRMCVLLFAFEATAAQQDLCADALHRQMGLDIKTELAKAQRTQREEYLRLEACKSLQSLKQETDNNPERFVIEIYDYLAKANKKLPDIGSPDIDLLTRKAYERALNATVKQALAQVQEVKAARAATDFSELRLGSGRLKLAALYSEISRLARLLKREALPPAQNVLIQDAILK